MRKAYTFQKVRQNHEDLLDLRVTARLKALSDTLYRQDASLNTLSSPRVLPSCQPLLQSRLVLPYFRKGCLFCLPF